MHTLSEQEKKFIAFWENQRKKPQQKVFFLLKGVRNGALLVSLIIASLLTGWYKRVALLTTGMLCAFLIACFLLVVFISVFTAYYDLEQNEQRYLELKTKEGLDAQ